MSDKINALELHMQSKIAQAQQQAKSVPTSVGMFSIKSANQTIQEAALRPNPIELFSCFWYEGEACCLFADSNVGKSIYAVQIANQIAQNQTVLYFDFELSDKQFQLRYTNEKGKLYDFAKNLYRLEINVETYELQNIEEAVINDLEKAAIRTGAKVLIIDNLTFLCSASEKTEVAGAFMIKLLALKRKYNLSILVLAHTPKRSLTSPITQNSLAGSKRLINFFDSSFAMSKSIKDSYLRYIKQIKVRHGSFTHDDDNVVVCSIEKENSFLCFKTIGYATEREHLAEPKENDDAELIANIKKLHLEGKSYRDIALELGTSLGKVQRTIKKI